MTSLRIPLVLLMLGGGLLSFAAEAQDADPIHRRVETILSVLRAQPNEASQACLDALKAMHDTEDALQTATEHQKTNDVDLANDVLETDYQNVTQVCGADATRVCNSQQQGAAGRLCAALAHHE